MEWNSEARYLDTDCAAASQKIPAISCAQYRIDWTAPSEPLRQFANDPFLYGARHVSMQKALAALRRLQALMPSVVTVTAGGERSGSVRDTQLYADRNAQCLRRSLVNTCVLEAASMAYPFDWMTAQVDTARLPPHFTKELQDAEIDGRAALSSSERLRELSQSAVYAAGR